MSADEATHVGSTADEAEAWISNEVQARLKQRVRFREGSMPD
jgi:hypothetical protein